MGAAPTRGSVPQSASAAEAADPERQALAAQDRGDREEAIRILMDAYGVAVYRYCRQMVADPDLADEVHQMTFVQAYESLEGFARRSSLRTWLYGIARHRALDALKVSRRRHRRFELVADVPEVPHGDSPEDRLITGDASQALRKCLEELAPRVRTAVLLRYQEGFSYPQMETVIGDRPATLQARVARAMPVLRRCLENQGVAA